jgi:uncharacterized membrane protein
VTVATPMEQTCWDIDNSCNTGDDATSLGSCNTLRTIRAWVIGATILSFVTLIVQHIAISRTNKNLADARQFNTPQVTETRATIFAILFALITIGLGFMATSLQVDFYVQDAGNCMLYVILTAPSFHS